jgi:adenylate cyclase
MPLARRLQRYANAAGFAINAAGGISLGIYLLIVFPPDRGALLFNRWLELAAGLAYIVVCGITAERRARPWFAAMAEWLERRPPAPDEVRATLRIPAGYARLTAARWGLGVPLFALPTLAVSTEFAAEEATAIALAGLSAIAAVYLATEWVLRPAFALALTPGADFDGRTLGIGPRALLAWLLCSGVPIVMIALIPVGRRVDNPHDLVAPIFFAAGMALIVGFVATKIATQAVTKPIQQLRRAIDAVGEGDLDAAVPVDDGSEIGRLQAGFNVMVAGLRERERLRDLYGRQVGLDVAAAALDGGWELGGQRRVVSALFVDVIGSTELAHREPPERVVALLNEFFATVVHVVDAHGGLVNKFEGDAAMCVFGAPVEQPDHATRALSVARELRARFDAAPGALDAAIGVACGTAVAGYIGAETRFEYTVLGDPVNEAARLTEIAKRRPSRLLASGDTLLAADGDEAARWQLDGEVVLRGRARTTRLAVPVPARVPAA